MGTFTSGAEAAAGGCLCLDSYQRRAGTRAEGSDRRQSDVNPPAGGGGLGGLAW